MGIQIRAARFHQFLVRCDRSTYKTSRCRLKTGSEQPLGSGVAPLYTLSRSKENAMSNSDRQILADRFVFSGCDLHRWDLPAHDIVAIWLVVEHGPIGILADDPWDLRHAGRVPVDRVSRPAGPSKPHLVHGVVQCGARRELWPHRLWPRPSTWGISGATCWLFLWWRLCWRCSRHAGQHSKVAYVMPKCRPIGYGNTGIRTSVVFPATRGRASLLLAPPLRMWPRKRDISAT